MRFIQELERLSDKKTKDEIKALFTGLYQGEEGQSFINHIIALYSIKENLASDAILNATETKIKEELKEELKSAYGLKNENEYAFFKSLADKMEICSNRITDHLKIIIDTNKIKENEILAMLKKIRRAATDINSDISEMADCMELKVQQSRSFNSRKEIIKDNLFYIDTDGIKTNKLTQNLKEEPKPSFFTPSNTSEQKPATETELQSIIMKAGKALASLNNEGNTNKIKELAAAMEKFDIRTIETITNSVLHSNQTPTIRK